MDEKEILLKVLSKVEGLETNFSVMQTEMVEMKEQLAQLPEIKEQLAQIPEMKEQLAQIPEMKKQLAQLPEMMKDIKELKIRVARIEVKIDDIDYTAIELLRRINLLEEKNKEEVNLV